MRNESEKILSPEIGWIVRGQERREGVRYAIEEMTELRLLAMALKSPY